MIISQYSAYVKKLNKGKKRHNAVSALCFFRQISKTHRFKQQYSFTSIKNIKRTGHKMPRSVKLFFRKFFYKTKHKFLDCKSILVCNTVTGI